MGLFSNGKYIVNGANNAAVNAGAGAGWIDIRKSLSIGFHIIAPSGSGTYIFETTNDDDPTKTIVMTATAIVLPAALATLAAPAAAVVNTVFGFGRCESTNKAAMPEAAWMKVRYAFSAGGAATGLFISIMRRGD